MKTRRRGSEATVYVYMFLLSVPCYRDCCKMVQPLNVKYQFERFNANGANTGERHYDGKESKS